MTYTVLRILMKFTLRVFYRRVYLSGEDNIPKRGPVMLACNHPNAFMEAIVLCVLLERPLYFLTRSDMFDTPLKRWLLGLINMLPIYRQQEGMANLHKNGEVFENSYRLIQKGRVISIFSEGNCVQEKRLRPLKKGTARMAFGAEEAYSWELGLQVVPVGINYTYPNRFREELIISVGRPMLVSDWKEAYDAHPAKAMNSFTASLYDALGAEMVLLHDAAREQLFERLIPLVRHEHDPGFGRWLITSKDRLKIEKSVGEWLNHADLLTDIPKIQSEATQYLSWITKSDITDEALARSEKGSSCSLLLLIVLAPISALGFALNALPVWFGLRTAGKKVRDIEFFSGVAVTVMFFSYLPYLAALFVLGGVFFGIKGLLLVALLPFMGLLHLHWKSAWQKYLADRKVEVFKKGNNLLWQKWLGIRKGIINKMGNEKAEEVDL